MGGLRCRTELILTIGGGCLWNFFCGTGVRFEPIGTKSAVIRCVFGNMKLWLKLLICLMWADLPTCAGRFKISLCQLPDLENFHFFVGNFQDENYVSGRFVGGKPDIQSVSDGAEVTETSEHHVSFDISGRSFIIESDGTVTIINENAEDRFYVSTVSQKPFPPVVSVYNREQQIVYVPYTSKDSLDKADENGFEMFQPDAWIEKHCEQLCDDVRFAENNKEHGSCHIF